MFKTLVRPATFYSSLIKGPIRISVCSYSSVHLEPYVNPRLSYAFGRGTAPLTNENISYFLDKLEQEPVRDLFVSNAEDKIVSNQELVSDVRRLAAGLYYKLRLRRGDTICLWSLNCYDWLRIFFACQSLGITVCTVNPYYKEKELAYALTKCKAKAIFLPGSESSQCKINKYVEIFDSDLVQSKLKQEGHIRSVVFIDENKTQTPFDYDTFALEELPVNLVIDRALLDSVQESDPAVIMYTSGTTGTPKGVVLSNHNIINNGLICSEYVLKEDDKNVIVLPLPLFHAYALVCAGEVAVLKGTKTVLTGSRFEVKSVVDSINKHKGTMAMFTPTMIIDTVNYLKVNKIEVPSLRTIMTGAAFFPPELANTIKEVIPQLEDIRIGYGLTESSPVVTLCLPTDDQQYRLTTVGRPIEYIEVKVVDQKTGDTVKHGVEGELLVRGHNVMVNYFEDDEKTKETLTADRWLKTGDCATMCEKGYVKICGRTKEMIIKGGENIYPAEIENILQGHSNVLDAYCFGIPDKRLGQVVGCWVKLADPKVGTTAEEIQSYCKSLITSYKVPTYVMFVDSFPLTPTGKAKKFEMTRITCEKLGIEQ